MAPRRRLSTQALIGAAIVIVGLLLLLDTTDLVETSILLDFVPSLFVLVGVYALVASGFRNLTGPVVVIVVAGAWQLVVLDVVAGADLVSFWPVLLILFGFSLLAGRLRTPASEVGSAHPDGLAVFGAREYRATAKGFEGADVSAIFGGFELDLRAVELAERPATVSALALFGGVEIIVPRDWRVEVDVLPVFGGASDERPLREEEHEEVDLVVTGFVAFGGVEVKD